MHFFRRVKKWFFGQKKAPEKPPIKKPAPKWIKESAFDPETLRIMEKAKEDKRSHQERMGELLKKMGKK